MACCLNAKEKVGTSRFILRVKRTYKQVYRCGIWNFRRDFRPKSQREVSFLLFVKCAHTRVLLSAENPIFFRDFNCWEYENNLVYVEQRTVLHGTIDCNWGGEPFPVAKRTLLIMTDTTYLIITMAHMAT